MLKKADKKEMPFLDHLEELRWRILKCLAALIILTAASFPLTTWMLTVLTHPNAHLPHPAKLIFLKPAAMMMVRMELSIGMGLIGSLPVILYQIWAFVAPGLLPRERRPILPVLLITIVCFAFGSCFAYLVLIPVMLRFLFSIGTQFIEAAININDYISFVMRLIVICGLIFEMPVLAFFLARIGLITSSWLVRFWRYAIVLILILAAVVTPTPDPVNMLILAVPLVLLYWISIWVAAVAQKKRNRPDRKIPARKPVSGTRKRSKTPGKKKTV
jgi:sec-independent protein translocase protein TatC